MLSNELIEKFQIFSSYPNASILELAVLLKSNRKMVLTDIRKINDILFSVGLPRIQIEESYIQMPDISLNDLFSRMSLDSGEYLFFEERLDMIILYILLNTDFVSNTNLQCLLQMSKNSVLSDLKKRDCRQRNMGGNLSILDKKVTLYVQPTQSVCFYLSKW
ncbi:conserved domain protein [Streptococcus constellatus subsp. pharyngis SK1060 = CCUG 46377]|uniref:Conserved domain protein n=1 Tax=Streptococcus constellatus subsp. pharyngis SK1060 = CCUG 46377 TaxID=1035184 RepID=F9P7K3_STRCV|nr:conserved domain protein [Streptococcus constellatus subsp. pharyngis SK1060 = CCUG 46377]